jgi:hypothetical protein
VDECKPLAEGRVVATLQVVAPPPDVRVLLCVVEGEEADPGYVCLALVPCVVPPPPPTPYINLVLTAVEGEECAGGGGAVGLRNRCSLRHRPDLPTLFVNLTDTL